MVQVVGFIVASYAIVRLLQIPIEHTPMERKHVILWILSLFGIGAIALLSVMLLFAGVSGLGNLPTR